MMKRFGVVFVVSAAAVTGMLCGARGPSATDRHLRAGQCVLMSTVAAPVVRDDSKLYFRGQPDKHHSYIAAFKGGDCPGLNRLVSVSIETSGSRYCEGDKVRAVVTTTQVPAPFCVIDRLLPFSGDVNDPLPAAGSE